jgi:hypothetical protein
MDIENKAESPAPSASVCYRADEIVSAMERRASLAPEHLTSSALREAGCMGRVCVLPEQFNERMSYLADVLVQSVRSSIVKDDRLRSTLGQLAQAMSYMMNSASWRDGELHDFDALELQLKLRRFVKSR